MGNGNCTTADASSPKKKQSGTSTPKSLVKLVFGSNKFVGDNLWNSSMGKFTDLSAADIDGKDLKFNVFSGQVLLVTNVACK